MQDMTEINELLLRVPGLNRSEAQRLGEEVADRLSREMPDMKGRAYIENLSVSIPQDSGGSRVGLADRISEQILTQLRAE
jgi:hypothetical protein